MAVKFISHVDEDSQGNWFIRLEDTSDDTELICKDLDEYANNIEELGSQYGSDIEVVWIKSKTLSPKNYQDLSEKMQIMQEEYKEEIDKINNEATEGTPSDDGFNPNEKFEENQGTNI